LALTAGGAWAIWKTLTALSPQVATAIIAGAATLLVSVFSVLWSKRVERLREIEQEQRKQKIPVYEEFLALVFRIVMAEKLGEGPVSEQDMMKSFSGFAQKMIVWGSDDVLKEYAAFRKLATTATPETAPILHVFAIERLLLAIRRDVGHKNKNFAQGDLLRIFINDVDTFLYPGESPDWDSK
jgi:hypothetical protein